MICLVSPRMRLSNGSAFLLPCPGAPFPDDVPSLACHRSFQGRREITACGSSIIAGCRERNWTTPGYRVVLCPAITLASGRMAGATRPGCAPSEKGRLL